MKRLAMVLAVALAFISTSVQADEKGQVSENALAAMGLSDMKVVSDEQGEQVRGQGAIAFGGSYAFFNGFFGGSATGNVYGGRGAIAAGGNNLSYSGVFVGLPPFFGFGYFAGGGSSAYGF